MQNLSQTTQEISKKQKETIEVITKIAACHKKDDLDHKAIHDSVTSLNALGAVPLIKEQESQTKKVDSAARETAAAPILPPIKGIIKPKDYIDFDKKSILENLQYFSDDLTDVLTNMVAQMHTIDTHYAEYLKISQNYSEFRKSIESIHHEVAQAKMLPAILDRSLKLFKTGTGAILYDALRHFEKRHLNLLKGLDINPENTLSCLSDLNSIFEECNKSLIHFSASVSGFIHFKDKPAISNAIPHVFVSVIALNTDMYQCITNFINLYAYTHSKLLYTLCRYMITEANKEKLITFDMTEKNIFVEKIKSSQKLNKILLTLKNEFKFSENILLNALWSEKEVFQLIYQKTSLINHLNNQVIPIRNFSQSLSISSHLIQGFCRGGIRDWSKKSFSKAPLNTNTKSKLDFETIELNDKISHLHDNQLSFFQSNQSGEHFFINAKSFKSQKTLYDEKTIAEFDSLNTSQEILHFLDVQIQKNDPTIKKFIDDMIETAYQISEQNYHQVTIEIAIRSPKFGHSLGFKFISSNNHISVYFCDYNYGEFYSNNLFAFKDWFRKYFHIANYASSNYSDYLINIIKPKKILSAADLVSQAISKQMQTLLSSEIHKVNLELKLKLPTSIITHITEYLSHPLKSTNSVIPSKALLCGFKTYLSTKKSHEDSDEFYRAEIKKQLTLGRKDESKSYLAAMTIMNLYEKIIEKNIDDHVSFIMSCFELLENFDRSHADKLSAILKMLFDTSNALSKENNEYDILQIITYFSIAKKLIEHNITVTWSELSGPDFFMQYYTSLIRLKNRLTDNSEFKDLFEKSMQVKNALDSGKKESVDLTHFSAILMNIDQLWSNHFSEWAPIALQELIQRIFFGQVEDHTKPTDTIIDKNTYG